MTEFYCSNGLIYSTGFLDALASTYKPMTNTADTERLLQEILQLLREIREILVPKPPGSLPLPHELPNPSLPEP